MTSASSKSEMISAKNVFISFLSLVNPYEESSLMLGVVVIGKTYSASVLARLSYGGASRKMGFERVLRPIRTDV
jgi:hypothetical protein